MITKQINCFSNLRKAYIYRGFASILELTLNVSAGSVPNKGFDRRPRSKFLIVLRVLLAAPVNSVVGRLRFVEKSEVLKI